MIASGLLFTRPARGRRSLKDNCGVLGGLEVLGVRIAEELEVAVLEGR